VSDRIGRRLGFQLTVAIFGVFGLASAFAPNAETLWALRFVCGFGLGGALPLDFSLMAEFLPRRNRGRWLVLLESFWAVGTLVIALLAYLLVPDHGWRPLLAVSGIAALLVLWIRRQVPESPRYLVAAGRPEEAEAILREVARVNGAPAVAAPLTADTSGASPGVAALWRGESARRTLMLWLAWFAIGLAYYGLFVYLPTILVDRGFSFVQTYGYALILAAAQIPGYLSAAWLVERWGRKPTLVAYLAASGVFTVLFGLVDTTALIVISASLMSFFSLGGWAALYAYTPESYPTVLRTTGMGWASAMARIAAALVTLLGAKVLAGSLEGTLVVFGAAFMAGALVVAVLGRETRGTPLAD
jgi:putative MFS transporter